MKNEEAEGRLAQHPRAPVQGDVNFCSGNSVSLQLGLLLTILANLHVVIFLHQSMNFLEISCIVSPLKLSLPGQALP